MLFIVRHLNLRGPTVNEQSILLSFLPYFHVYGMIYTVIVALTGGAQVVTLPRFHPKEVLRCIEKYKVSEHFIFEKQSAGGLVPLQ